MPLFALIVFSRSLYGMIGSAGPPAAQAYIADRTSAADRTSGMAGFAAAFGLGAYAGAGLRRRRRRLWRRGAVLRHGRPRRDHDSFCLPFSSRTHSADRTRAPPSVRIFDRRLTAIMAFAVMNGLMNSIPMQTIGFYFIDKLGYSTAEAPQIVGVGLMGGAMASLFSQLVIVQRFRLEPRLLMRIAPALFCVGHLMIWAIPALGTVIFGLVIAGFARASPCPASARPPPSP